MPSRLRFLPFALTVAVGLFALTSMLTAQPPAAPPTPEGIKRTEEENLKLYKRFADELLKLAQKWEKSDSPDEKERAKTLRAALKVAEEKGVENMFKYLLNPLTKNPSGGDFQDLIAKDKALQAPKSCGTTAECDALKKLPPGPCKTAKCKRLNQEPDPLNPQPEPPGIIR